MGLKVFEPWKQIAERYLEGGFQTDDPYARDYREADQAVRHFLRAMSQDGNVGLSLDPDLGPVWGAEIPVSYSIVRRIEMPGIGMMDVREIVQGTWILVIPFPCAEWHLIYQQGQGEDEQSFCLSRAIFESHPSYGRTLKQLFNPFAHVTEIELLRSFQYLFVGLCKTYGIKLPPDTE